MKVVLLKNVQKVGKQGHVCTVSDGYARNFLIPRGLAVIATVEAVRQGEQVKKRKVQEAERELYSAEDVASAVDGLELEFKEKANESGTLFASVTAKKIAEALQGRGYTIQSSFIRLDAPIKELGEYQIKLEFPHGLEATVQLIISQL